MFGELKVAAKKICEGGLIAYPTEYCFGLGCDPNDRAAVLQLLRIKRRLLEKGVILIAANVQQLEPYVDDIPPDTLATWPGPYTWLLKPRPGVAQWITGRHPRIALRVTAHRQAAALCRLAGTAIVSTSANRAGEAPARHAREVRRRLGKELDYVLSGKVGGLRHPTSIRDAVTGKVVRAD
jgi:L-threonylcarbamoyladenylate synthase